MRYLFVTLVAVVALSAAASAQTVKRPWTLLVYGAADNNADGPIIDFLDRVRQAIDDDPGIDVLLLIDRHERYAKNTRMLGKDFTGARLYRVKKASVERLSGGAHFPELTTEGDVEIDSADAANIGRFIAWGKATSPAERYALLIYSHANGRTMCPDDQSKRDMGIAEVTDKIGPEGHVDFLALELCGMGGIEIAYQWRPGNGRFSADVLLAIPNAGPPLDWHMAFARLRSSGHDCPAPRPPIDPAAMSARDFGDLVIEEGRFGRIQAEERGQSRDTEAAASYDLSKAAAVKESVDAFARELARSNAKAPFMAMASQSADGALIRYSDSYVDLYDLCRHAAADQALSADSRRLARAAMEATDGFVLSSFGMEGYPGFEAGKNGVFIVLPSGDWPAFRWYTPRPLEGRDYGRWSFLRDGATPDNGAVESWFELLDSWLDDPEKGGINGVGP